MKDSNTLLVLMLAGLITGVAAAVADCDPDAGQSAPTPPAIEQAASPRNPA